MKFYNILGFLAVTVISIACSHETGNKKFNNFTGLWTLHRIESKDSVTGKWSKWKNETQGYILYDDKDHMAVHITAKNYEKAGFRLPFLVDTVSLDALKHRTRSITYFAKYTVSEENKTVKHARITHSDPGQWNVAVTRKFTFNGDTLVLEPIEAMYAGLRLKWIKESLSNKK